MSNKFPEVSQPQKPLETSENLRKPWKPHDLEIYVSFPGNLLERISVETYGNLWKSWKSTVEISKTFLVNHYVNHHAHEFLTG